MNSIVASIYYYMLHALGRKPARATGHAPLPQRQFLSGGGTVEMRSLSAFHFGPKLFSLGATYF